MTHEIPRSNCCDAPLCMEISGKGEDALSMCSFCKEWCGVSFPEDEEESEEARHES